MPTGHVIGWSGWAAAMLAFAVPISFLAAGQMNRALAEDYKVSSGEVVRKPFSLKGGDSLVVKEKATISLTGKTAILIDGICERITIKNAGLVTVTGSRVEAIDLGKAKVHPKERMCVPGDVSALGFGVSGAFRIENSESGTIESEDGDAVRLGEMATLSNKGRIEGGSASGSKSDGIDLHGAYSSKVYNRASGTIIGRHQGINGGKNSIGRVDVFNDEGGLIVGRNGAGIGSDYDGHIANFGTIRGQHDPDIAPDGDGDGIDIDYDAEITNAGLIEGTGAGGVDSRGGANFAEGIAIGGGTVVNEPGARIVGRHRGILVDNGSGGAAHSPTEIANIGIIEGLDQYGIRLIGPFADMIFNLGTIKGANGVAVRMGDGDDEFQIAQDSKVEGIVDAEAGHDRLVLVSRDPNVPNASFAAFDVQTIGEDAVYRGFEEVIVEPDRALTGVSTFSGTVIAEDDALDVRALFPDAEIRAPEVIE